MIYDSFWLTIIHLSRSNRAKHPLVPVPECKLRVQRAIILPFGSTFRVQNPNDFVALALRPTSWLKLSSAEGGYFTFWLGLPSPEPDQLSSEVVVPSVATGLETSRWLKPPKFPDKPGSRPQTCCCLAQLFQFWAGAELFPVRTTALRLHCRASAQPSEF
jgi:hypothetical protein